MESGFRNFIFEIVVEDFQDFISEIASDTSNIVDQRLLQMGERIKLKGERMRFSITRAKTQMLL